ncbi:MAG: hypothetical protein R2822_25730 [Spirosomataceae bacterium]
MYEDDFDLSTTAAKISVTQTLGVSYDKGLSEDIATADAEKQAEQIVANLKKMASKLNQTKKSLPSLPTCNAWVQTSNAIKDRNSETIFKRIEGVGIYPLIGLLIFAAISSD